MRQYKYLTVLLLLCVLFLTACSVDKSQKSNQRKENEAGSSVTSPSEAAPDNSVSSFPVDGTDESQIDSTVSHLEPIYDPQSNSLALTDLAANTILVSYPFDSKQFVLSADKVSNGVVVLATAEAESDDSENQNKVLIQGMDSDENITVYRFDQLLNLRDSFRLDDPSLPDDLVSYPLAVSWDGNTLTWVQEEGIYQYNLETSNLKQVPLKLPEAVYFDQIRYSDGRETLFYFGGGDQEDVIAYGALDVETGEGTLFHAKGFDPSSITVTGDYAVVNAAVPPGALSGNGHVLFIDSIAKTGNEITLKSQNENDLAAATDDGKTLVTCAATDGKSGVLRFYDTASGDFKSELPYSCEQEGVPYLLLVQGKTAQVVLRTEQGFVLSSPVPLA